MDQTYIPLKDAAALYNLTYDRLRRAAYDGRLLVQRRDNRLMVRPAEIDRYIAEGGKAPRVQPLPQREGAADGRVIAVAIPKGGTGKTTTTINLGVALAERGQRVLLIDCDPQASMTMALGFDPELLEWPLDRVIGTYLQSYDADLGVAIQRTDEGVDLVPSSVNLNNLSNLVQQTYKPNEILAVLIAPLRQRYDFILLDTLPYLGVLVMNALAAADEVLVPLQAQLLASASARLVVDQIAMVRRSGLNSRLAVCGFLLTQVDSQASLQRDYVTEARRAFGEDGRVFDTQIEARPTVQESQHDRKSMFRFRPNDPVTQSYRHLAAEVLNAAH